MNIGEAARQSGVSAKMIRYYESIGLVPAAARTESRYRTYSPADVHRLRFVRRARDRGFSIERIHRLLELWSDRTRPNAEVRRVALAHVAELEAEIERLRELADVLKDLAERCAHGGRPDCPILADLEGTGAAREPCGHGRAREGPPDQAVSLPECN